MSVKSGRQSNANRLWIPLVFGLLVIAPAHGTVPAVAGTPSVGSARELDLKVADAAWDEFMGWLIEQLMNRLNCGSPSIPEDVPVAMLTTVTCYASGGLKPMSTDEKRELMATLDEAEAAMRNVPSSVPLITTLKFEATLKLMRAEALLGL